jgi:hypothetical protein
LRETAEKLLGRPLKEAEFSFRKEPKGLPRVLEKLREGLEEVWKGDYIDNVRFDDPKADQLIRTMGAKVTDINGVEIVLESFEDLHAFYSGLLDKKYHGDGMQVVRSKNRFHEKKNVEGGYRDVQLLVLMPAKANNSELVRPVLVEMQLHLRSIYDIKSLSHLVHECTRASFDPAQLKDSVWGKGVKMSSFWNSSALEQSSHVCAGLLGTPACLHAVAVLVEQEDSDQLRETLHGVLAALLHLQVPVLLGASGGKKAFLLKLPNEPFTEDLWHQALKATRGQGMRV